MKSTAEYLDAVKGALNLPSDYALAKHWGVSKQDVSEYRSGKRTMGEDRAIAVAEILKMHPGLVMLDMHRERAKSPVEQSIWQDIFEGFLSLLPLAKNGFGALS